MFLCLVVGSKPHGSGTQSGRSRLAAHSRDRDTGQIRP
jgi:hypothetical protein